MTRISLLALLGLGIAQLAACGGDSSDDAGSGGAAGTAGSAGSSASAGTSGTSGSAGSAGTSGSAGSAATGGAGGTLNATRKCGIGLPCSAGDTCSYTGLETGANCDCDPSGHYLCDSGGAGAPPFNPCNEHVVFNGASCEHSNGYCTRTCTESGCEVTCDGKDANVAWEAECTPAMCEDDYWGWGGCEISEGSACSYKIDCVEPGLTPSIEGICE